MFAFYKSIAEEDRVGIDRYQRPSSADEGRWRLMYPWPNPKAASRANKVACRLAFPGRSDHGIIVSVDSVREGRVQETARGYSLHRLALTTHTTQGFADKECSSVMIRGAHASRDVHNRADLGYAGTYFGGEGLSPPPFSSSPIEHCPPFEDKGFLYLFLFSFFWPLACSRCLCLKQPMRDSAKERAIVVEEATDGSERGVLPL